MISLSSTSSRDMWLSLKLNQPAPPSSSLQLVSPHLCHAMFRSSQPTPPSSFPPVSESSFVTCHASKLTIPFLPLPPLQLVSPCLCHAAFQSSPTCSSLFLPSSK